MLENRLLRLQLLASALALAPVVAACSGGGPEIPPENRVKITITNDVSPATTFTVYVIASGSRRMLGEARPGRTSTFEYGQSSYGGTSYVLAADPARAGAEVPDWRAGEIEGEQVPAVTSDPFRLFAGAQVTWALTLNRVLVLEPQNEE